MIDFRFVVVVTVLIRDTIKRDAQDDETVWISALQLDEVGYLGQAGGAPGGPEV